MIQFKIPWKFFKKFQSWFIFQQTWRNIQIASTIFWQQVFSFLMACCANWYLCLLMMSLRCGLSLGNCPSSPLCSVMWNFLVCSVLVLLLVWSLMTKMTGLSLLGVSLSPLMYITITVTGVLTSYLMVLLATFFLVAVFLYCFMFTPIFSLKVSNLISQKILTNHQDLKVSPLQ